MAEAFTAGDWTIRGRRIRTLAEVTHIAAERDGLLAVIEVKTRPALEIAAYALTPRQCRHLAQAAAILQGENPGWGPDGLRFDA